MINRSRNAHTWRLTFPPWRPDTVEVFRVRADCFGCTTAVPVICLLCVKSVK
jgi:hypothetical protein